MSISGPLSGYLSSGYLPPVPTPTALMAQAGLAMAGTPIGTQAVAPVSGVPLSNGASGYFIQVPGQARSLVNVMLPVGLLPPGAEGLLVATLQEGSEASKQINARLLDQGIYPVAFTTNDKLVIGMEGPAGQEAVMTQALLRMLTQPVVDSATFNSQKMRSIQATRDRLTDPDDRLYTTMSQRIYGPMHRFCLSPQTRMQLMAQHSLPAVMGALQQTLQATRSAKVMMVSALPVNQQRQILNSALQGSSWYPQAYVSVSAENAAVPLPNPTGTQTTVLMPTTAINRALIKTRWKAPDIRDPDYPAFCMLESILRGRSQFSFFQKLRNDHGLVYSVDLYKGSKLVQGCCYNLDFEVDCPQIGNALNDVREVTQRVCQQSVSPAELETVKKQALLLLRRNMQEAMHIGTSVYMPWLASDAPLPSLEWLQQATMKVTPADVQRVANRIFNAPDGLQMLGVTAPEAALRQWFPGQPFTY